MSRFSTVLRVGESLMIGDAQITLQEKNGRMAKLIIEAAPEIHIQTPRQISGGTARKSALQSGAASYGEHSVRRSETALP